MRKSYPNSKESEFRQTQFLDPVFFVSVSEPKIFFLIYFLHMESYSGTISYIRRYPRVDLDLNAEFKILSPETAQKRYPTQVKNLGGGGLKFISSIPLSVGTYLQVHLNVTSREIDFIARVIWTEQMAGKDATLFKCGLEYVEISNEDLLYLHHILGKHSNQKPNN